MDLFRVDDEYDEAYASDGVSRFGFYLRQALGEYEFVCPGEWEAFCWRSATSPVMSPGYVREHPAVGDSSCFVGSWDGTFMGELTVAAGLPVPLPGWSTWWTGWEEPRYDRPRPVALTHVTLTAPLDVDLAPVEDIRSMLGAGDVFGLKSIDRALTAEAKTAVGRLVRAMNESFGAPVALLAGETAVLLDG